MSRMRFPRQLTFWLAVGGVALLAPVVFNLAVDKFGEKVPALKTLNGYMTRSN